MADGLWAVYNTYHANIHVGLLNLMSPDTFSGVKMVKNALAAGEPPQTVLGELATLARPLAGLREEGRGG